MEKYLSIIFIFFLLTVAFSVNAALRSPHYKIEEDSLEIDIYRTEMAKDDIEEGAFVGQEAVDSSFPLWKIILAGLIGLFLIIGFFIWLKSIFRLRKKSF